MVLCCTVVSFIDPDVGGPISGMTQRLDSENELITCHVDGRLMFWDIDYAEPVAGLRASIFGK